MEYSVINVDAENEHFEVCDSVISWMENCKTSESFDAPTPASSSSPGPAAAPAQISTQNVDALSTILPPPHHASHHLSAPELAWNLVRIFCEKRGTSLIDCLPPFALNETMSSPAIMNFQQNQQLYCQILEKNSPSPKSQQSSPDLLYSNETLQELSSPKSNFKTTTSSSSSSSKTTTINKSTTTTTLADDSSSQAVVRMRGNDEWAPPRAQIIFNIHEEVNFRKSMQRQNYLCAGCGTKIDLELARRLVLYCHYLGKYFCKCCFSHKAIHLPGYILQKWDFHKYPVSQFALQLVDKIANEPLFNIDDINSGLYRKVRKLKHLIDIRMQLYYLKIYITTCTQTDKLSGEYDSFSHQHLLQDDVHLYSLNNLIEIQHGKLYEYLNDLVTRSVSHIAQCDRCRAKGHYCQLCGPSSLMSSMILSSGSDQQQQQQHPKLKHSNSLGQNISSSGSTFMNISSSPPVPMVVAPAANLTAVVNVNDHQLIFPFEIGRVAQCRGCGCCFHLQCFVDAGQNCPKCERIQRRKAEMSAGAIVTGGNGDGARGEPGPGAGALLDAAGPLE